MGRYERMEAASITYRPRARVWWIQVTDPSGEAVPDSVLAAASSADLAKTIGREMAEALGWVELGRWRSNGANWELMGGWYEKAYNEETETWE